MKKNRITLALNKYVGSELNFKNIDAIKGGGKTQADTLCISNAIICQASVNFSCESILGDC